MNSDPTNAAVINRPVALQRLGGNEQLLGAMAGFFLEDAPALRQQLVDAHRAMDFELVARLAHSLKGLAMTFEAIPFRELIVDIESLARARDQGGLDQKMAFLDYEFDRLVLEVRSLVQ